ncbi:MAG: 50S ribosomal protein L24 [Verrucomicrobia bacterium]|nr:50S ribosomal protein L24 [Verrucomicrobiota bacterium]
MRKQTMNNTRTGSKKVRAGDTVVVTTGACKGQSGKVIRCSADRVLVQGINLCKKHVKKSEQHPQGGIIEMEKFLHVSNVCPCDANGTALKLQVRFQENGEKELCYEKDGELVVWRSMKRTEK